MTAAVLAITFVGIFFLVVLAADLALPPAKD